MVELKEILKAKADQLGWGWHEYDDGSIELENWSPAGEDIVVTLAGKDIAEEMVKYSSDFDVDEHVEPLVAIRGTRGVPSSISVIVTDALEIEKMLDELACGVVLAEDGFLTAQIKEVTKEEAEAIIGTRKPIGVFLCMEDGRAVGIDNRTGDAWTEDFDDRADCLKWLLGWNKESEEAE